MNKHVLAFVANHKDKLKGRVIEIGSYNVNGSVRDVIDVAVGVDVRKVSIGWVVQKTGNMGDLTIEPIKVP